MCWQLPIRRTFRDVEQQDGRTYTEGFSIGEVLRPPWIWGESGHDLD
jgi:hypothetical protein